jgi:hypothetical protein
MAYVSASYGEYYTALLRFLPICPIFGGGIRNLHERIKSCNLNLEFCSLQWVSVPEGYSVPQEPQVL